MDHPLPWLKYVDAADISNASADFDGMTVENMTGEKLGQVEAFVVDSDSARPYYVVVDSGGWFRSRRFLLPIGHAHLDRDTDRTLVCDLPRERIDRFPGFDKDEFEKLTPETLKRFNDDTCEAIGVAITYSPTEPYTEAWHRDDFGYPNWWQAEPSLPTRMGDRAFSEMVDYPPAALGATSPLESFESIRAQAGTEATDSREPSPHFDGRAQPGDVIGLETGGEQTHIGDTREDENRRRVETEKTVHQR